MANYVKNSKKAKIEITIKRGEEEKTLTIKRKTAAEEAVENGEAVKIVKKEPSPNYYFT